MYVEYFLPARRSAKAPIVLVHGANQSGANFTSSLTGSEGWAAYFLRQGHSVYVVDQVGYGRSGPSTTLGAPYFMSSDEIKGLLTHPAGAGLWPQARRHDQWPPGDAAFKQFVASQLPGYLDAEATDRENTAALLQLLAKIGPAVVLTHSRAATFGWLAAEARSDLVRAIVAVEPHGPPYMDAGKDQPARPLGIAYMPFSDQTAANAASSNDLVQTDVGGTDVRLCWRERANDAPPRLTRLRGIPVLVVTGEASYHARYDHCTVDFLRRRGLQVTFLELQQVGITGNGHMLMLERNSRHIAQAIGRWLSKVGSSSLRVSPSR
jgi:pimeloyl-ACP methyl ester carboxylesterase